MRVIDSYHWLQMSTSLACACRRRLYLTEYYGTSSMDAWAHDDPSKSTADGDCIQWHNHCSILIIHGPGPGGNSSSCRYGQYQDTRIRQLRPFLVRTTFYLSHLIFGHMYGALNINKKITNCTVCMDFARRIF
jgi:hypothetical protein